jgi:hypothetical protein
MHAFIFAESFVRWFGRNIFLLQVIFRVGRSMLPLARLGLSALDKWYCALPPHLMKPLLMKVLPYLDPFLRSKGNLIKSCIKLFLMLFLYRYNSPISQ